MDGMGPGLALVQSRRRLLRAALAISLAAVDDVSEPRPGDELPSPYQELTDAARDLDKAQAAYDGYLAAKRRDGLNAMCPHARPAGTPCPWCLGING
jgi:hypothetical protein